MVRAGRLLLLLLGPTLTACAGAAGLPPGFAENLAEAPEGRPVRFRSRGDALVAVAVPAVEHVLPPGLRRVVAGLVPGGRTVWFGREWGPLGHGFRLEKRYGDGGSDGDFRTVLVTPDGTVLERTHSLAIGNAPQDVLRAAMTGGRMQVERVEVVQRGEGEEGYRVRTRNALGRTFVVAVDLRARVRSVQRVLDAELSAR